jgi:hypothetical protein
MSLASIACSLSRPISPRARVAEDTVQIVLLEHFGNKRIFRTQIHMPGGVAAHDNDDLSAIRRGMVQVAENLSVHTRVNILKTFP